MYRKFKLYNSLGNVFDLTDKDNQVFMTSPNGLGFEQTITSDRLGNAELEQSSQYSLGNPSGEILFYDNVGSAYQRYLDFIQFSRFKPLYLYYLPPNTLEEYYAKVEITKLEKTEYSKTDKALHCPITFKALTMWLNANEQVISATNTTVGNGKYYALTRDYSYSGSTLNDIQITNNGSVECGIVVEITGDVTNPQWSVSQSGETYGTCRLIGLFDYVRVNSIESENQIYLENNGSVLSNPEQYQDLSIANNTYLTFIKLRVGTNVLNFSLGSDFDGLVKIKFRNQFISI